MTTEDTRRALTLISGIGTCRETPAGFWQQCVTRIVLDLDETGANHVGPIADLLAEMWVALPPRDPRLTLERRSRSGQIRHLAAKLREGCNDVAVSVALDMLADETGEPAPDPDCQKCGFRLPNHDRECSSHQEGQRP
jgi:hypothetical protein